MAQTVGFWILAVISVAAAIMVVATRNPVRCALYLIVNFVCLAIFYLILGAQLLAGLQVLVYAGAIMVLFLFVIMLLNLGGEQVEHDPLVAQRPVAALFGIVLLGFLGWTLSQAGSLLPPVAEPAEPQPDPVFHIGQLLFTQYVYPFEVTSLLLLVGIIGTILLAKRRIGELPPVREPLTATGILSSTDVHEVGAGAAD
jgi:NADH-quinone oxidoreductase subunit J